jgi:integrase
VAQRRARRSAARHAPGHGADRREIRRRRRRVPALDRARPCAQAVDVRDYQSIINAHLLPAFGTKRLEDITTEGVERWAAGLTAHGRMNNRTKLTVLTVLHGVMGRARRLWKLPRNPVSDVEKPVQTHRTEIDVFSPEDVMALVRAAASNQDAAIYLTAALTGLRRVRARRVALARRRLRTPPHPCESELHRALADDAQVREGPLGPARAGCRRGTRARGPAPRVHWRGLVFPGIAGTYLDASALYRRYKSALARADLRDCASTTCAARSARRSSGTRACRPAAQGVDGYADIDTTMNYVHFAPQPSDADLVAEAFGAPAAHGLPQPGGSR